MTRIGICLGDVTGIGPEVTLKALASEGGAGNTEFLLIGDKAHAQALGRQLGLKIAVPIEQPGHEPLPLSMDRGSSVAARAAVTWLKSGAQKCLRGELDALVTAPVNKEAIVRAGIPFVGQTELLSQLAGTERTAMMLLGQDRSGRWLRVALATTHVPLREVADHLTVDKIEIVIELASQACLDLGLSRARVAVCGLNPHAGEGGKIGQEEISVIAPAVARAAQRGFEVSGPWSADALFYHVYRGEYEAVVAMYHDQGLAPLKMVAFESGVNWTLGLPFIRTSPDHGTAYDISGQGRADPSSMMAAIKLAKQLAKKKSAAPR
jgi:4-hydroxythreonine-4-phosphate dehydrogenase